MADDLLWRSGGFFSLWRGERKGEYATGVFFAVLPAQKVAVATDRLHSIRPR